ncbi:MAG: ribosome assembly RNA-binding protein YhbY [Legionellales bacterium]|nr:ribosome assembly RNA-binding protein YhbY [Legionellales bacterium]
MNNTLKKAMKAQAHHLRPVILMGNKGLTEHLVAATDEALSAHELIKIKLMGEQKADRLEIAQELCAATHAEIIQIVGRIATIYRKNPEAK